MKLTPEQKLIEAAKLDGLTPHVQETEGFGGGPYRTHGYINEQGIFFRKRPDYGEKYDAVIPLIQKQLLRQDKDGANLDSTGIEKFWDKLNNITDFFDNYGHVGLFNATPSQLLDALLTAKGFEI